MRVCYDLFDRFWRGARLALAILLVIGLLGCDKAAPRNQSLPPSLVIADFSSSDQLLTEYVFDYDAFEGDPSAPIRSKATTSLPQVDGRSVLAVSYELAGRRSTVASCGLWMRLKPAVKRKDWSVVACELKAGADTGPVKKVIIETRFSGSYYAYDHFNISSDSWSLCVLPITKAHTGTPDEDMYFTQLVVSLANGVTTPNKGTLMLRRVYLLRSEEDIPAEIEKIADIPRTLGLERQSRGKLSKLLDGW
jgi:hypothetical protein